MMNADLQAYNKALAAEIKLIADSLADFITNSLKDSESKIWHGHPVWFLHGNPLVGYSSQKDCIRLLFWSGQSFEEPALKAEGKFKAAEIRYYDNSEINNSDLKRWLEKCREIQWDYKNLVKRKGVLQRLEVLH